MYHQLLILPESREGTNTTIAVNTKTIPSFLLRTFF